MPNAETLVTLYSLDYIFKLESPHTCEVSRGHPLTGNSGEAVAKFLLGKNNQPAFGELVDDSYSAVEDKQARAKAAKKLLRNRKIAIMEVSGVQLQIIEKKIKKVLWI